MTDCGKYNTVGSRCTQPAGHDGEHRSQYGATWTDESNAKAIEYMLKKADKWRRD